jgi:hypothetical protein
MPALDSGAMFARLGAELVLDELDDEHGPGDFVIDLMVAVNGHRSFPGCGHSKFPGLAGLRAAGDQPGW